MLMSPPDTELYVKQCVSGYEGLFLLHGVRIHTNHPQHRAEAKMWMHVLVLISICMCVHCRCIWRIRFYWMSAISIFVLVCIFIEVETHRFHRTLETRLPCQCSPQTFPSSWGTEGFSVRLWECPEICDTIIPLTHSNQELPRGCSGGPFTAALSGTTLILTRPNTLSGIKACFI